MALAQDGTLAWASATQPLHHARCRKVQTLPPVKQTGRATPTPELSLGLAAVPAAAASGSPSRCPVLPAHPLQVSFLRDTQMETLRYEVCFPATRCRALGSGGGGPRKQAPLGGCSRSPTGRLAMNTRHGLGESSGPWQAAVALLRLPWVEPEGSLTMRVLVGTITQAFERFGGRGLVGAGNQTLEL